MRNILGTFFPRNYQCSRGQLRINFLPNCGTKYHFERPGNGMKYRNTQEREITVARLGMRILPGGSVFWTDSSGRGMIMPDKRNLQVFIFSSDLCPAIPKPQSPTSGLLLSYLKFNLPLTHCCIPSGSVSCCHYITIIHSVNKSRSPGVLMIKV